MGETRTLLCSFHGADGPHYVPDIQTGLESGEAAFALHSSFIAVQLSAADMPTCETGFPSPDSANSCEVTGS